MPDLLTAIVRCPHCHGTLARVDATLRCPSGHAFDVARQGYVNLLAGHRPMGDDDAMVRARSAFLDAGHYTLLGRTVGRLAADLHPDARVVVDAGAGTGHHLVAVLDHLPRARGLAVDASKAAGRRAARIDPRVAAVVWNLWRRPWPLADGVADVVLNVLAPRNGPEMERILDPGGALIVATPAPAHLEELVEALGLLSVDPDKAERLSRALDGRFVELRQVALEFSLVLSLDDVAALVAMGPSAHHLQPDALTDRLGALKAPIHATAHFVIRAYRRARSASPARRLR